MAHRWFTSVLHGRWCSSVDEALFDALRAGQAVLTSEQNDEISLKAFTGIEEREPRLRRGPAASAG